MNPTDLGLFSAFLIGLAGSVHCIGMCGGIVGAFTFATPKNVSHTPYILSYNLGRIVSYAGAGAMTGWLGAFFIEFVSSGLQLLRIFSVFMLVLLGFYISGWWKLLTYIEKAGNHVWRKVSPMGKRFIPFKTPLHAIPYGMIWGWLPCGLVYSTLSWSMASASPQQGALIMLFFGMGTLPSMLLLGSTNNQYKQYFTNKWFRNAIAILLFIYAGVLLNGL